MGSKAPSWADQWGTGNFDGDDGDLVNEKGNSSNTKKKVAEVKAAASAGFDKAKSAAAIGAQKLKDGTSVGFKWVKNQCQKKYSSK